jgi:hypothetical protein
MRTHPLPRWFAIALLAALLTAGVRPAHAAPLRQDVQINIVAFVDVAPATDPNCPGCNGEFDAEDSDFAANNPLPSMTFIVKDSTGAEIARGDTTELTVGIQRYLFTVPEGPQFTVELDSAPSPWQLCPNESASRTLTDTDFQLGNARVEYHFTQGCNAGGETPTIEVPTETPTTPVPGQPTNTPVPPAKVTEKPKSSTRDETEPALGYIKGIAFIDENQNGKLDPTDPGLNDVKVYLDGGGLQLSLVTPGTGNYSFDGLGPGTYDVYINPGPEWKITTQQKYVVTVAPGQVVMGIDFGLARVGSTVTTMPTAGRGVRQPATGIADLPAAPLLGMATLLLGALGALGMSLERRRARQQ